MDKIKDKPQDLSGILFLLFGIFCLVCMDAFVKLLIEQNIFAIQTLAIRCLFAIPSLALIHLYIERKNTSNNLSETDSHHVLTNQAHTNQADINKAYTIGSIIQSFIKHPVLILRGVFGVLAPFSFFTSLNYLSIADATVVFFASTFCSVLLSIVVLKEQVGWHRWAAIIVGFVGVFIAINPQGEGDTLGYALVLFGSLISAGIIVSGRLLTRKHRISLVVLGLNTGMSIPALLLLPWFWNEMNGLSIVLICAISFCVVVGHLMITTAFSKTPAAILAPFDYSALPWSILLGYIVWKDIPDFRLLLGASIIVVCGIFVAHRERKRNEIIAINKPNTVIMTTRTK